MVIFFFFFALVFIGVAHWYLEIPCDVPPCPLTFSFCDKSLSGIAFRELNSSVC